MDGAPLQGSFAAVLIVAALYGAQAIATRAFHDANDGRCLRWSASVAAGIWTALATFHLLAAFGRFAIRDALAVAVVGALAVRMLTRVPFSRVIALVGDDLKCLLSIVLGRSALLKPLRALLAIAVGQVFFRALLLPPLGHDAITYHAVKAALWVQSGGALALDLPGGWNFYRHFPPGGEILGAWAMLPFHADTLYVLTDVMLWLAFVPTLAALCSELGVATRLRSSVLLYVLTCGAIYYFIPSGYVDVTLHLLLSSTILFTLRALRGASVAASAAFALGCACAALCVKVTAIAAPAIVGVALAYVFVTRVELRACVWRGAAIGAGIGLCTLGPILLHNTLALGYPLSPFRAQVLGLTLGRMSPELSWYADPAQVKTSLKNEMRQLAHLIGIGDLGRPTFGAFAWPLLLLAPLGLRALHRDKPRAAWLVAVFVAYQCVAYVLPDFAAVRFHYGYSSARLFFLVPIFAALLTARLAPASGKPLLETYFVVAGLLSVVVYARTFPSAVERAPWLELAGCGLALLLAAGYLAPRASASMLGYGALGIVCAALVIGSGPLQALRAALRYPALASSIVGHPMPAAASEYARLTDDVQHPYRIAVATAPRQNANRQLMYYFLGSKLQNQLVYVSTRADAGVPVFDGHQELAPPIALDAWVERVRASRASYVIVLAPAWHEGRWMLRRPNVFELVAGNGRSWLFHVRGG